MCVRKVRTLGTFDEFKVFYTIVRDEYPDCLHHRLSPVHYGEFDLGEGRDGLGLNSFDLLAMGYYGTLLPILRVT